MLCPFCGQPVEDESPFCGSCGNKVRQPMSFGFHAAPSSLSESEEAPLSAAQAQPYAAPQPTPSAPAQTDVPLWQEAAADPQPEVYTMPRQPEVKARPQPEAYAMPQPDAYARPQPEAYAIPTQPEAAAQPARPQPRPYAPAQRAQNKPGAYIRPSTKDEKSGSGNKGLIIAICCVVAAVLIVGVGLTIILLNRNQQASGDPTGDSAGTSASSELSSNTATSAPTESATAATSAPTETTTEAPTEPSTEPTEPSTEPTTEPPTEPTKAGVEVPITSDMQYKLNIFLSNFSESNFNCDGSVNDADGLGERMRLVFSWFNLNKHDGLSFDANYNAVLTLAQMNDRLSRFFNETIDAPKDGTVFTSFYGSKITYNNGTFSTPWGEGDSHADFTVVKKLEDNGDGTFTAYFDVYTAEDFNVGGDHLTDDSYYRLTANNVTSKNVTFRYSGTALLKPYKTGMIDSYQLVEYRSEQS